LRDVTASSDYYSDIDDRLRDGIERMADETAQLVPWPQQFA